MIRKLLWIPFAIAISTSCTEDIPDCPSRMCIIAGSWKLTQVFVENAEDQGDFSNYRLTLSMPSPTTATTAGFSRVYRSGTTEEGTWSLENNNTVLRLLPAGDPLLTEDWIIENLTPRELILVLNRDTGIKQGPSTIRFVLEPI